MKKQGTLALVTCHQDCPLAQFRDNIGLNFICRPITPWNVLHLVHYKWKESEWEKRFESGDRCLLSFLHDIDIDECAHEKGGCQDICVNSVGSYYCSCSDPEFSLASDKRHCIGMYMHQCWFWLGTRLSGGFKRGGRLRGARPLLKIIHINIIMEDFKRTR